MLGGPHKSIGQCTNGEIRALVIAGTLIALVIAAVTFFSSQPGWFLWPVRAFAAIWLGSLWYRSLWELRKRREDCTSRG